MLINEIRNKNKQVFLKWNTPTLTNGHLRTLSTTLESRYALWYQKLALSHKLSPVHYKNTKFKQL